MIFFWCKFGFRKCFGASTWSRHLAGGHQLLDKIHFFVDFRSQSEKWLVVVTQNKRKQHFKMTVVWFPVSSPGTHLLRFLTFPICFKCWMAMEWSTLISSGTSHVFVRESALMMALNWSLSPLMAGRYTPHLQGSCALQNFLNHCCSVHSLAVSGPNALLMLRVVSAALRPISNSKKSLLCFFSNIISIV